MSPASSTSSRSPCFCKTSRVLGKTTSRSPITVSASILSMAILNPVPSFAASAIGATRIFKGDFVDARFFGSARLEEMPCAFFGFEGFFAFFRIAFQAFFAGFRFLFGNDYCPR